MGYDRITFDSNTLFCVTGGAGFIGSALCEALLKKGVRVRCVDNLSTGSMSNIEPFLQHPRFEFIRGDVQDPALCDKACNGADYVLHQAALGSVPRSVKMPQFYCDNNVKGTLNMLESAKNAGVKRFVYASSSSVYGDEQTLPKKEGREGKLLSPYALTKRANEDWARLYTDLYSLETVGLRYFNVFGRRQNPNGEYAAIIPKFIKQLTNGERPTINGDGTQSRDFTYVENVIEANLRAVTADGAAGEVFNVACGGRVTLLEVYKLLCRELRVDIEPSFASERKGDIKHSNADISKAKHILGYDPDYDFERGLHEAIEWYKQNL